MSWRFAKYLVLIGIELVVIAGLFTVLANRFERRFSIKEEIITPTEPVVVAAPVYELVFVGDMMFDRNIRKNIAAAEDPLLPFALIKDEIKKADVAFGNLEGPISDGGKRQGSIYSFRFEPVGTINALTDAGFDVVSIANNHIWDYGREAALDTMKHLGDVGINYVGFGKNFDEANSPVIKTVGDTRIAYLGYTEFYSKALYADDRLGLSEFDSEKMAKRIKELRESGVADIIIVSLHWGEEYQTTSNAHQRQLARTLVDAGANLIIGHHPHVAQEIEEYHGATIAYSLGNFVFDQNFSADTQHGLMLKAKVVDKKINATESVNVGFTKIFQPYTVE
jgi:poly-gamma-glutamate synthesis protein (capsule biosynthesis protein)